MISITASSSTLRLWSPAQLRWLLSIDLVNLVVIPLLFILGVSSAIQQADNYHNPRATGETVNPTDSQFAAIQLSLAVAPPACALITSFVHLVLYSTYTLHPVTVLVSSIVYFLGWVVVAFTTGIQGVKGSWNFQDGYAATPLAASPAVTYYYVGEVPTATTTGAPPPTPTPYSVTTSYPYRISYLPLSRDVHVNTGLWLSRLVFVSIAGALQVAYMTVAAIAVDANRKARRQQNKAQVTYIEPVDYEEGSTAVQAPSTTRMHPAVPNYSPAHSRQGSVQSYTSDVEKEKDVDFKDPK